MKYGAQAARACSKGRPPHGGRGLKSTRIVAYIIALVSPPARGAWIEIWKNHEATPYGKGRPPHGGRGLKSMLPSSALAFFTSPPARGAWIEISSALCR